jgi:hypothetical protein
MLRCRTAPRRVATEALRQRPKHRGARGGDPRARLLGLGALLALGSCDGGGSGNGGGGSGGGPALTGAVGLPCTTDADCPRAGGPAFVCITPDADGALGNGAPQDGYCSAPCQVNADCHALDELSSCAEPFGDQGAHCLATCQPGVGAGGQPLLKCGSDRAQVCTPTTQDPTIGLCLPRCQSDSRCAAGRVCDPGESGLCLREPKVGGGVGAACRAQTEATDCASGICFEYRAASGAVLGGTCSAGCTFATSDGCGYDGASGGPRASACLQPQLVSGAPGDLGFCFPLCDFASDCEQDGWACRRLEGVEEVLGRAGECVPAALVGGGVPGPDAGVGDAGG